jgi:HEAT repeat protein
VATDLIPENYVARSVRERGKLIVKLKKQIFGRENAFLAGRRAVRYWAAPEEPSYLPHLAALLRAEPYPAYQSLLMQLIARIQSPEALPLLYGALESGNRDMRRWGVWGLGALKAQEAVPKLAPFLERGYTRDWTAAALVEIGDPRGVELLEAAADQETGSERDWLLRYVDQLRSKLDQSGS